MKLGYGEDEIFAMTPRKFFRIYDEYLQLSGARKAKRKKILSIDALP